jgi:hypothetical protein
MAPLARKSQPRTTVTFALAIDGMTIARSPNKMRVTPSATKKIQWSWIDLVAVSGT